MAMIGSLQARQHGSQDFQGYYTQLCALQDACPLTSVKAHLSEGALDLNADRIRLPDWTPILNTLRINKSLEFVGCRSYFQQTGQDSTGKKGKSGRRQPPIRTKDVSYRLCVALKECLTITGALTFIELQGIPLRSKDVQALTMGIQKNTTLQHLSLEGCRVGDGGVKILTSGLKNSPAITSLNFSACGVSAKGAELLAKLIKHQSTKRHSEAWKESLRYRRPDLDRMAGVRRITLNANPTVGDEGAWAFADALRDDLWLKALDVQQCGISNIGAKAFLDTLHENSTIVVLDIRKNPLIDHDLLKAVMEQVMINGGGRETEYKWLHTSSPKPHRSKSKRSRTKSLSNPAGKKSSLRGNSTAPSKQRPSRSKSPGGALVQVSHDGYHPSVTKPGPGFVPWRTAARASQRSMAVPMEHVVHVDSSSGLASDSTSPTHSGGATSVHVHVASSTPTSEQDTSQKDTSAATSTMMSSVRAFDEREELERRRYKDMQVEIEELRRRMYIESRSRSSAEARVIELEVDNSRLKHHIQLLEARSPGSPLRMNTAPSHDTQGGYGISELEDESVLDSIEESFQKFHGFLDLLKEAGLGQLCNLVGLGPQDLKTPMVASILQSHHPFDQPAPLRTMGHPPSVGTSYVETSNGFPPGTYPPSVPASRTMGHPSTTSYIHTGNGHLSGAYPPSVQANTTTGHSSSVTNPFAHTSNGHPPSVYPPSVRYPSHTEPYQYSKVTQSSAPLPAHTQHADTMQQHERTVQYDRARPTVVETDSSHTVQGKNTGYHKDDNIPSREGGISPEPRLIHSKPLVSPPVVSSHASQSDHDARFHGVQTVPGGPVHTQTTSEPSSRYQPASLIGTQDHPPQSSILPPMSGRTDAPMSQPSTIITHGAESSDVQNFGPKANPELLEAKSSKDGLQVDKHHGNGQTDPMKDILLMPQDKPSVVVGDSMSATVGSVVSFTNPERPQLKIGSSLNYGAGDAEELSKPLDEARPKEGAGDKETAKGSASEDDYEDDFATSSDTGTVSNNTPRNMSDRTSTPSKSSASHRTYTRSSMTGSNHSDDGGLKSLGSSIAEDISDLGGHTSDASSEDF